MSANNQGRQGHVGFNRPHPEGQPRGQGSQGPRGFGQQGSAGQGNQGLRGMVGGGHQGNGGYASQQNGGSGGNIRDNGNQFMAGKVPYFCK